MSKEMSVIVLGVWIMLVPYLGVPSSWKTIILLLTGFLLIVTGFLLRSEALARMPGHSTRRSDHHPFVEKSSVAAQDAHSYHDQTPGIRSLN